MDIEVIRIIVNKLPSMCFMCPFGARTKEGSVCAPKYNTRKQNNNHKYYVDPTGKPPDWCPLVTELGYMDELFYYDENEEEQ